MTGLSGAAAAESLKIREIEVQGAAGALAARVYTASEGSAKLDSLIVFFHGGGFVEGDLEDADDFLRHLVVCNPGCLVLATNYTLAPVSPFPAAVEDAHAVLNWARKNKAKLGWNGKQMVVAGIEAGANLAAVSALMSRDRGGPEVAGQVLIMPMLDPGLSTSSMRALPSSSGADTGMVEVADACAACYRGYLPNAADRTHPYASPLQSSRLKNLPPALILSAEDDPLRDEAEQYGAKLIACGVPTTVQRMQPAPLQEPGARNECACRQQVLSSISAYLSALDKEPS